MAGEICKCCGTNQRVVASPMLADESRWTIYRQDGVEVTFYIKDGIVKKPSVFITFIEMQYIQKHIIPNFYEK